MARSDGAPKRCAIYTRKSSEEGLEQDFNSLARAARSLRGIRQESGRRGLAAGQDGVRRRRILRRDDGAAGAQGADRRHRAKSASTWWSSIRSIA